MDADHERPVCAVSLERYMGTAKGVHPKGWYSLVHSKSRTTGTNVNMRCREGISHQESGVDTA